MKRNFVILISLLFAGFVANAQFFQWNESALQHRVKQLDEFMKRFNYELDVMGKPIPTDKRGDIEGRKKILSACLTKIWY